MQALAKSTDVTSSDSSATAPSTTEATERVPLSMTGRFMLQDDKEIACGATAMSLTEVALTSAVKPAPGTPVRLYLVALGRFRGTVTRVTDDGFEMKLEMSRRKQGFLVTQLGWFASRHRGDVLERRRHQRIVPLNQDTVVHLPWKGECPAKIISISITGVGLEAAEQPPVDSMVVIGNTPGIVVRHFPEGFACEFIQPFAYSEFDASIQP